MTKKVIEGLTNKYGAYPKEWALQSASHGSAPEGYSKLMVWYTMPCGVIGRQWLETIEAWSEGNLNFHFEHTFN